MTTETLSLQKDQKIDLTKGNSALKVVCVGLGWDVNSGNAAAFDLDAFCALIKEGKLHDGSKSVIYFRNLTGPGVSHSGDNLTGAGEGDDEMITVKLTDVPVEVTEIQFFVNIYEARARSQRFGSVKNAFIRLFDGETKQEIAKYDLTEDFSNFTGVKMGRMYKHNGEWKFEALGVGVNGDINEIITAATA